MSVAKQQPEPQRLLFVFLEASLPKDHNDADAVNFSAGQGGALHPLMCADKTLDELGSFADLVTESEKINKDWQIVLVAALSGKNDVMPDSDAAEEPLKAMMETVQTGGNLSKYMAFDRGGEPVQFN